jgi:HD-GYP domain-containing protein (c-di-GMP phosphodiesterase class II)
MKKQIRLRGLNGIVEGKVWESDCMLRVGWLASFEIVLDDNSVSGRHAEIRPTADGWRVRDLGSTTGTYLNGNRLGPGEWPISGHDTLRFGNATMVVDILGDSDDDKPQDFEEDALSGLAFDYYCCPRPGEQLKDLLRERHNVPNLGNEEVFIHTTLNDALGKLEAQRAVILLVEDDGSLRLRAIATGPGLVRGGPDHSETLAQRCIASGESVLCRSLKGHPEVSGSNMGSVLCVLLRTPRKPLGVLHLDRGPTEKPFTEDHLQLAATFAARISGGIQRFQLLRKQRDLFCSPVRTILGLLERQDEYTGLHSERVAQYSMLLAEHLNLSPEEVFWVGFGALFHDYGKIGIRDEILKKPSGLTPEEFKIMQTHTSIGAQLLEAVSDLAPAAPVARSHHERWDGQGYPDGLKGPQIPLFARIVAVANAFDAMTSNTPYRAPMPVDTAFSELEKQRGKQFDPDFALTFINIRQNLVQEMTSAPTKYPPGTMGVSPGGTVASWNPTGEVMVTLWPANKAGDDKGTSPK